MPTKNKTNKSEKTRPKVKKKSNSKVKTRKPRKPRKTKKTKKIRKIQKYVVLNEFKKILVGIAILIALCLTVAMIADIFFQPGRRGTNSDRKETIATIKKQQNKPEIKREIKPVHEGIESENSIQKDINDGKNGDVKNKKAVTSLKQKSENSIKYEVFKKVDQTLIEKTLIPPETDHIPKIVIIIDDIGYDKKMAMALCDLDPNITFSILPFVPFGSTIAKKLHARGAQLMLHLPMEPFEYPDVNPGPGAILSSMPPDILLEQLKKSLNDIPYIAGVNNHMGSKITANANQMNQIFSTLKKENLFFIDSRTVQKSQCQASAKLFKLRFAQRDVFLDNVQDKEYITGQFNQLKTLAKRHGFAIGIGHPYKATLETLAQELPKIKNKIQIVRASKLTSIPG